MAIDPIKEKQRVQREQEKKVVDLFYERVRRIREEERKKSKEIDIIEKNKELKRRQIEAAEDHFEVRKAHEATTELLRGRKAAEAKKIRIDRTV